MNQPQKFQDLLDRSIDYWRTLFNKKKNDFYEVRSEILQSHVINELSSLSQQEKEQFSLLFRRFLKLKFAEGNAFLDGKKFNLSYSRDESLLYSLAELVLFYCFLCGTRGFPWAFQELETARLISFVFNYNVEDNLFSTLLVFNLFQNYELKLDRLNPEEVIKHVERKVFYYIVRGFHQDLGLLRVYFFFLKDNDRLKELFLNRIKIELVSRNSEDQNMKERLNLLNQLPFVVESITSLINEDGKIEAKVREVFVDFSLNFAKELSEKLENSFPGFQSSLISLSEKIKSEERYSKELSYDRQVLCNVYLEDLIVETLEDIRRTGKQLINEGTVINREISYKLLDKMARFLYFTKLNNYSRLKYSAGYMPDLAKMCNISSESVFLEKEKGSHLAEDIHNECIYNLKRIVEVYSSFIQERKEVLCEIEKLSLGDKQKVLDDYREVIKRIIQGRLNIRSFTESYEREVACWRKFRGNAPELVFRTIEKGEYSKLFYTLIWNWERLAAFSENEVLPKLAYFYFLIMYTKEKKDDKAYQVIKSVLKKKLSPFALVFFFDDCVEDLEVLKKLKWLSFVLSFLIRLPIQLEYKWKEADWFLKIQACFSIGSVQNVMMLLLFPEVKYAPSHSFWIDYILGPEDIFSLQHL